MGSSMKRKTPETPFDRMHKLWNKEMLANIRLTAAAQEILDRPWWKPENLRKDNPPISQEFEDAMRASDIKRLREAVDFALGERE